MADRRLNMILTEQEQKVIDLLAITWNEFLKLPEQHPMHHQEFASIIHEAQRVIMSRPVARALNWVKPSGKDDADGVAVLSQLPSQWWLISDEDVERICMRLNQLQQFSKIDPSHIRDVQMWLDTGLHVTDAVPGDFAEDTKALNDARTTD